jgi:succinate-semialdehyde dehydrogenase / glutarate-semialdehyde dehydrogenase
MKIKSINPYTEEVNWTYDSLSIGECRALIKNSRAAFLGWNSLSAKERAKYFGNVADLLFQKTPDSVTITQKMRLNY